MARQHYSPVQCAGSLFLFVSSGLLLASGLTYEEMNPDGDVYNSTFDSMMQRIFKSDDAIKRLGKRVACQVCREAMNRFRGEVNRKITKKMNMSQKLYQIDAKLGYMCDDKHFPEKIAVVLEPGEDDGPEAKYKYVDMQEAEMKGTITMDHRDERNDVIMSCNHFTEGKRVALKTAMNATKTFKQAKNLAVHKIACVEPGVVCGVDDVIDEADGEL